MSGHAMVIPIFRVLCIDGLYTCMLLGRRAAVSRICLHGNCKMYVVYNPGHLSYELIFYWNKSSIQRILLTVRNILCTHSGNAIYILNVAFFLHCIYIQLYAIVIQYQCHFRSRRSRMLASYTRSLFVRRMPWLLAVLSSVHACNQFHGRHLQRVQLFV